MYYILSLNLGENFMKKKKKSKPRKQMFLGNTLQEKTFNYYNEELEEKTEKFKLNSLSDTEFYLFQSMPEKNKVIDKIFNLAYFYDTNFTGNRDFMHIPTINQIAQNFTHFPIMLATQKNEYGVEEILGVTTIKMENNASIVDNPYFPTKNENILSITGVLTKYDAKDRNGNKIRGIGKELYKSAIKAAYELNKEKTIRLICEIDCRNIYSLKSISNAVKELQSEDIPVRICIPGYYEIYNNGKTLKEAPTFILEVDLNGDKNISQIETKFSYLKCESTNLFSDLVQEIQERTKERRKYVTMRKKDFVIYHSIKPIDALKVELEIGNTADGNNRVPISKPLEIEYAIGNVI